MKYLPLDFEEKWLKKWQEDKIYQIEIKICDHSIGDIISSIINRTYPDIKFCSHYVPHPLQPLVVIRINDPDAISKFKEALDIYMGMIDKLQSQL